MHLAEPQAREEKKHLFGMSSILDLATAGQCGRGRRLWRHRRLGGTAIGRAKIECLAFDGRGGQVHDLQNQP
jgi:hypothetical protein